MATYKELLAQKQALEAKLAEARATEVAGVIQQIQTLMAEYGLTAEDLAPKRRRGRAPKSPDATEKKTPLPAKYRDPKSGATWSGRGKPPAWIAGKNRARFAIAEE